MKFLSQLHALVAITHDGSKTFRHRSSSCLTLPRRPSNEQLKYELRHLLECNGGSTASEDVVRTIELLSLQNPSTIDTPEWLELFTGEFITRTTPTFPGRLNSEDENSVQYRLGRLSFNTFQPQNLVCTLGNVRNAVFPKHDGTFTYDLKVDTVIHIPGEGTVDAEICNESFCFRDEKSDRVLVSFKGSSLSPAQSTLEDHTKLSLWRRTFNKDALDEANKNRSILDYLIQKCMHGMLGINLKQDLQHGFRFDFKKAIMSHFDVLYLDEDMRITRGSLGTLVVADRMPKFQPLYAD